MQDAAEHKHTELSGEALEIAACAAVTNAGERWTEMRAQVFAEISKQTRPVSAYDIADRLSAKRGKRVAPNSVYRILDLFVATNVAMRIESENAYIANCHPGAVHDCIFLVCDTCGGAVHIDDDAISRSVRTLAKERSFDAVRPVMEIRGRCGDCASSARR